MRLCVVAPASAVLRTLCRCCASVRLRSAAHRCRNSCVRSRTRPLGLPAALLRCQPSSIQRRRRLVGSTRAEHASTPNQLYLLSARQVLHLMLGRLRHRLAKRDAAAEGPLLWPLRYARGEPLDSAAPPPPRASSAPPSPRAPSCHRRRRAARAATFTGAAWWARWPGNCTARGAAGARRRARAGGGRARHLVECRMQRLLQRGHRVHHPVLERGSTSPRRRRRVGARHRQRHRRPANAPPPPPPPPSATSSPRDRAGAGPLGRRRDEDGSSTLRLGARAAAAGWPGSRCRPVALRPNERGGQEAPPSSARPSTSPPEPAHCRGVAKKKKKAALDTPACPAPAAAARRPPRAADAAQEKSKSLLSRRCRRPRRKGGGRPPPRRGARQGEGQGREGGGRVAAGLSGC